ncbi:MAG: MmgE/PrpD family protein [Armatimonadetes bacterium]|nr:MmgE/PrpD family protein [Armatimonadota bacterium]MDE2205515.1 MmgE/PrpD family protein [Armatimonadota bacterium]
MTLLAERLSAFASRLRYEDIPLATRHEARRRLLDSLGCAMGAWDAAPAQIARKLALTVSSTQPAAVIGTTHGSSPEDAAFANGVMFRYLDYNDTYLSKEPAHPSDNIAAALAAAEIARASGEDLITAIVLAYEVQCRLCDACSIRVRGWDHVTYGSFSATLAACKLLGLTAEQMTHAQGLAGVPNNAMRQTRVGMLSHWKGCAFANASRNALFAARLAALGMTGPSEVFEGEMGFFHQVSGPFEIAEPAGDGFMIDRTYIKLFPAEYHSQSAIDAALKLRTQIADVADIESITIESFRAAVEIIGGEPEKWRPTTRETADHSLPWCTAAALMDGAVTQASFDDAHLHNELLLALVQKIDVRVSEDLDARYPEGIPNRLIIRLRGGTVLTHEVTFPKGHAGNKMSDAEVEAKFRTMAEPRLGTDRAAEVIDRCLNLDAESRVPDLMSRMRVEAA